MRQALPHASERRVCRLLAVPRSSLRQVPPEKRPRRPLDAVLVERLRALIRRHPTFGYRKLWALLRFGEGLLVNPKKIYRILAAKRWFVHQRTVTPRPRVQGRRSIASASDLRWAIDLTHIYCGEDGWGHLAAIIDCHDREIVGYEFALRGRACEAERALEGACLLAISRWIHWYKEGRPHQALGHLSPRQYRTQQLQRWLEMEGALQYVDV